MSKFGKKIIGRLKNFVGKAQASKYQSSKNLADGFTCHTVTLNLRPKAYDADDIVAVRKVLGASQAVFARFLGVSRWHGPLLGTGSQRPQPHRLPLHGRNPHQSAILAGAPAGVGEGEEAGYRVS